MWALECVFGGSTCFWDYESDNRGQATYILLDADSDILL